MRILGIETSCDETAAAVVADGRAVLANVIATQHELHAEYGGVVPEIASRAHVERVLPVIEGAMREAGGLGAGDIDAVAVGHRPGLIGSLMVGVSVAKALSWVWGLPLIGVDHVAAHLHAARLFDADPVSLRPRCSGVEPAAIAWPAVGLVVSGGHTTLYRMAGPDAPPEAIGRTIDDAVGEAYDKAAVILGLPYPGGPSVDRAASEGDPEAFDLPRSMLDRRSLDFSLSGLKTALLYTVRGKPQGRDGQGRPAYPREASSLSGKQIADLAASFQAAVMDVVMAKLRRAREAHPDTRSVIVGGGVAANSELRRRLEAWARQREDPSAPAVHVPAMSFCTDNAAMIAGAAHAELLAGRDAGLDLPAVASTSLL